MTLDLFFRILEIIFGAQFLFFGLNGFFNWFAPPLPPPKAVSILEAFGQLKYLMPLIKSIEVCSGLLLVLGYYKVLALLLIAPISLNIFAFHFFVGNRKDPLSWAILFSQILLLMNQSQLISLAFSP